MVQLLLTRFSPAKNEWVLAFDSAGATRELLVLCRTLDVGFSVPVPTLTVARDVLNLVAAAVEAGSYDLWADETWTHENYSNEVQEPEEPGDPDPESWYYGEDRGPDAELERVGERAYYAWAQDEVERL